MKKILEKLGKDRTKIVKKSDDIKIFTITGPLPAEPPVNQRLIFEQTVAFVTFSSIELRNDIIRAHRFKRLRARLTCKNCSKKSRGDNFWISLEPGPKVSQISWENVSYALSERKFMRYALNSASYLVYTILSALVRLLQSVVLGFFDNESGSVDHNSYALYLTIIIGVQVIYKAGNFIFSYLGNFSIGRVKDQFSTINIGYIACMKFFAFLFSVTLIFEKNAKSDIPVYVLIKQIFKTMMIDAVLQAVFKMVGFSTTVKYLKIFYFSCVKKKRIMLLQSDLNEIFGKPGILIGSLTSIKLYIVVTASLFGFLSWLLLVPLLAYLIISWIVDRFILLKFYSEPNPRDFKVSKAFLYLTWFPITISLMSAWLFWGIQYGGLGAALNNLGNLYGYVTLGCFVALFFVDPVMSFFILFFEERMSVRGERSERKQGVIMGGESFDGSIDGSRQDLSVSLDGSKDGGLGLGGERGVKFDQFYEDVLKG